MIDGHVTITIYRKEDYKDFEPILKGLGIESPVIILEFDDSFEIKFCSEYLHFEIDIEIERLYDDYVFIKNLGKGLQDVRIQITRYQSPASTDNWGRPLEERIDETVYLVKKPTSVASELNFNPRIKVLFDEEEKEYYVNIVRGVNKETNVEGYLLLNTFSKLIEGDNSNRIWYNTLFETKSDAFWSAISKFDSFVEEEFKNYKLANKKKRGRPKKV